MKQFGIAFQIWGGTVMLSCAFIILYGIARFEGGTVALGLAGFIVGLFITSPLLVPTTLLVQVTCKIPYNSTVRIYWLGFMLVLLDYLFFQALTGIGIGKYEMPLMDAFFFTSILALVIMLFLKRTALKKMFSQQTTNKES